MKKTISIFSAVLMMSFAFGQKKELRSVEKALKKGNTVEAKATLQSVSSMIDNADAKYKAQYYFLKGSVYSDLAKKGMDTDASFKTAGEAFKQLFDFEKSSGKLKYTKEAKPMMQNMIAELVNKAINDQNTKNFKAASDKLYLAYELEPSNKDYLYFAGSTAISGKDYDTALKHYEKLKGMNYTGVKTQYYATNKATGKEELFNDKTLRDISIKARTHNNPQDKKSKSRLPEIVKNIAWIYSNHVGDNEKALVAVDEAIKANPDDSGLLLTKGSIYHKMGQPEKFKEVMTEIITKNPNDVVSHYNIGVITAESGDLEQARKSYRRVLELDPGYIDAGINLAKTYIDEASDIVDKMNQLGNSSADNKKFEEYQGQQTELYKESLKVLETTIKSDPDNIKILRQLKGLYSFLGEDEKFKKTKAKLAELGQ